MPYPNATTGPYRIPYWSKGDRSSGISNLRAAQIVENQLTAQNHFFGANGVIQEGLYTATFSSGNSSVTLATNGSVPAIEAVINQAYVNQNTTLTWTGFPNSATVYLYAQAVETNIYLPSQQSTLQDKVCSPVWNSSGATPANSILLGKVVTTTSTISLDTSATITDNGDYTAGKPIFYSFSAHRTATPIDHPNLSVTDPKLANEAVLSRTIAPWDGISSGTDTVNGKGIATGHIKNGAVTLPKMSFTGGDLNITGNISVTGSIQVTSGISVGDVVYGGAFRAASGLDVTGNAVFRNNVSIQGNLTVSTATISKLATQTVAQSGLDVAGSTVFRSSTTFQQAMTAAGFRNSQDMFSGLQAYFGNIYGRSGVNADMGYSGRVAFYRQPLGFVPEPLQASVDEIVTPAFNYPATITEVIVSNKIAPTSTCVFQVRNATGGAGDVISVTMQNGERYASGLGNVPLTPGGVITFRPSTVGSSMSGLNVYVSGYQKVPSPSNFTV